MQRMRDHTGQFWTHEVSREQRCRLVAGESPENVILPEHHLLCAKDAWDAANFRPDSITDISQVLTLDRSDTCFFFPHSPGMFLSAATEVERRLSGRREAEKDRALTRRAFWVALAALVVSILANVANVMLNTIRK
jgi:hypothetical protein